MMKILVTGGAGFIGSHLVDTLSAGGHEIVVLDNLFRGRIENLTKHLNRPDFTFIDGDIREFKQVEKAIKGCQVVYHLAAQSNVLGAVTDISYSFETNVVGTFNVLQAARAAGVNRFIFTSSREVYGEAQTLPVDETHPLDAKNAYGVSKIAGEKYVRVFTDEKRMQTAILRLSNVYGLRDFDRVIPIFIENCRTNSDIKLFGGQQVIDFISVQQVVKRLEQLLKMRVLPSQEINIGSGIGTSLQDLAERIKTLSGAKSNIRILPARSAEVVKFIANNQRMLDYFDCEKPADPLCELADMIKITNLLK